MFEVFGKTEKLHSFILGSLSLLAVPYFMEQLSFAYTLSTLSHQQHVQVVFISNTISQRDYRIFSDYLYTS